MLNVYACLLALALMTTMANRSGIAVILPFTIGGSTHPGTPFSPLFPAEPPPPPRAMPLLEISARQITFPSTGTGYYRDTTFTIRNGAPGIATVRIATFGDIPAFQLGATSLQVSDSGPVPVQVRFRPIHPDSCSSMVIVITQGTTSDTVVVSGCSVATLLPFDGDSSVVDFGGVRIGSSRTLTDSLRPLGLDSIAYIFSPRRGDVFHVTEPVTGNTTVHRGSVGALSLTFAPYSLAGSPYRDTILCRTSMGDRLLFTRGTVIDTGSSGTDSTAISLGTIDFGSTYLGTSRDSTFTVSNLHNDQTLQVTQRTTGEFEIPDVQSRNFLLRPGETRQITIRFTPSVMGSVVATDSIFFSPVGGTAGSSIRILLLRGSGISMLLRSDRDTVVIDSLRPGFCGGTTSGNTDTISISNHGNVAATVSAQLAIRTQGFTLVSSQLFQLDTGGRHTIVVQFCGSDSIAAADTILLYDVRDIARVIKRIPLIHHSKRGGGPPPSPDTLAIIRITTDTVDFGDTDIGGAFGSQRIVTVHNDGDANGVIDIDTFLPIGGSLSGAFTILSPRPRPIQVPAHDSTEITLEFRPTRLGDDTAIWRVAWRNGDSSRSIVLLGRGVAPHVEPRVRLVSFGNAHERVGRPIRLTLVASRDTVSGRGVAWDSAVVIIDPMAFRLMGVEPAELIVERGREDSAIILRPSAGMDTAASDSLFTLVLMGLSTGQPFNRVAIDSLYAAAPVASGTNGVVQLDGCDVGRGLGGSLKPAVSALRLDPSASSASLTYRAAEGAVPSISLMDMNGATILRRELPAGSGAGQSVTIPLRDIPPGLYWLELRVESDRVVTPIMITR